MKNGARILCFNLSTLLFVLLTALPAFAQDISVNITVNEGGTASGVGVGECGNNYTCGDGGTFCSFSFPSSCGPAELDWFAQNGYDSNGNYDAVFNSWSGCPDVSNSSVLDITSLHRVAMLPRTQTSQPPSVRFTDHLQISVYNCRAAAREMSKRPLPSGPNGTRLVAATDGLDVAGG